jgi:predicted HicB family RNase H-like nuclease
MMQFKGYTGHVVFDDENDLFHGEVLGLRDVITFQGRTVQELRRAFRESVEDYLAFCRQRGETPEKPLSGRFILRVPPELHREISREAGKAGLSLNAWITSSLQHAVSRPTPPPRSRSTSPKDRKSRSSVKAAPRR